jgi:sugar phosphate permease
MILYAYLLLSTLSVVLGMLIALAMDKDNDIHYKTCMLIEIFVTFMLDGLMLLTNWEIMEMVPKIVSGTALGFATACRSGICLSTQSGNFLML